MSKGRTQPKGQASARENKRAQFTEGAARGSNLKLIIVILALAGVAGYLVFANMKGGDDIGPHNEDGCNPVALTQTIEGDHLVIMTSELEKGTSYF